MGKFRESAADDSGEQQIDISPLIDCVFILLIFFIVTTVFVEETGVEVNKPQAGSGESLEKNSILIAVTAEDDIVYGKQPMAMAAVQPLVERLLRKERMPVIVQGDRECSGGVLVRVIDACYMAGAEKVNVSTVSN